MRAITAPEPGGPEALTVTELPDPEAGPGEVVIDVVASAVNRADTLQRQGFYPPPEGASEVLGLECSGRISAVGAGVEGWSEGDEVCALLAGGGYAEKVAVPAGQVMPVPSGVDLKAAGAIPEVACTVWSNVFMLAGLQPDETLLVHGGAGGIGNFAIQLAKAVGARVFTTAGSAEKIELCESLGADRAINYHDEDFVEVVKDLGGADVILDNMGAQVPRPQRLGAGDPGPTRRSSACRAASRASSTSARSFASGQRCLRPRCAPGRPGRRQPSAPRSSSTSGR